MWGEVVGEEEECVYLLGFAVSREEFFVEVDVAFSVYAWLGLVGFELDGAVNDLVSEGFIEVSSVAEDIEGQIPAVN